MKRFLSLLLLAWLPACSPKPSNPAVEITGTGTPSGDEIAKKYPLDQIKLPPGFSISIFAEVDNARSLTLSPQGTLYVGNRSGDKVYAVRDTTGDGRADAVYVIASGLDTPNGVAFRDGSLYVAENSRILRFDEIEKRIKNPPPPVVVSDQFPGDDHHGWKFIAFGPDGKLYVPVGAPCNNCKSENPLYASIARLNPDGSRLEVFAHGIRNSVGFAWHPHTKELWFTNNGRDMLGDNLPPDELSNAPRPGMHFGYPYCHAGSIADPEFGQQRPCSDFTPPVQKLAPHTAALGMRFYTGQAFPETYRNAIFIAEHGSWNRSSPVGYRLTWVKLQGNQSISYETFAEGWLVPNGQAWGRPVDVEVHPDGSLLVSDDKAGVIYRIAYQQP